MEVLPNPNTPLAFLPPKLAEQYEISRYIYVASLGAYIWDILSNLPQEYRLLFKYRFGLPTAAYFISRIGTLAYVTTSTVFQISTVDDCQALQVALGCCFVVAVGASSFLFFLRIYAIFNRQRIVIGAFFLLWLLVVAFSITIPFSIDGTHIGTTKFCINSRVGKITFGAVITSTIHDTLVLAAVSWRLIANVYQDDLVNGLKDLFGRGNMPAFSRALLKSGQQYYLITVGSNILTMVMLIDPKVPAVYHAMFTIPNVALMNSMACRVFRAIRFGTMQEVVTVKSTTRPSISFTRPTPPRTRQDFDHMEDRLSDDHSTTLRGIEMTKTVEVVSDSPPPELFFPRDKGRDSDVSAV